MLGVAVRVTSCIVLDKQSNHTRLHFAICKISLVLESSDMVHPQILGDEAGDCHTFEIILDDTLRSMPL